MDPKHAHTAPTTFALPALVVLVQPLDPISVAETVADVLWRNPTEDRPL